VPFPDRGPKDAIRVRPRDVQLVRKLLRVEDASGMCERSDVLEGDVPNGETVRVA